MTGKPRRQQRARARAAALREWEASPAYKKAQAINRESARAAERVRKQAEARAARRGLS